MKISSAEFLKLSVQDVADLLLDQGKHSALCHGLVDDEEYLLEVRVWKKDESD